MNFVRVGWSFLTASLLVSLLAAEAAAQDVAADAPRPVPGTNLAPTTTPSPVAAPAPAPTGFLFDTGAPLAGIGSDLANYGVYLKGFYTGVFYADPSGGTRNTNVFYNDAFYGADFVLDKMLGISIGTVIHFSLDSRWGGVPQGVNDKTGFSEGFLVGTGPDNNTRLNELSIDQHLLDDKIRFVVGRVTLADYFGTSQLYCQFVSSLCSNMVPFNWSSNSNNPFFPIATWAGQIAFWPTNNYYVRVGASEANSSQFNQAGFPWNAGWGTRGATGVFLPVEAGYVTRASEVQYPTKVDVGFYHDTSNFNTVSLVNPQNDSAQGSSVVYGQVRQMIYRPDPKGPATIDSFAGALFSLTGHVPVQSYFEAGLVANGLVPGRPNDSIGLDFLQFQFNHRYTGLVTQEFSNEGYVGRNDSNQSELVELNYGFGVAPGVTVKPYAQYTFHPDQNIYTIASPKPGVNYAFATGVQLFVLVGPALGLPGFFREY
jgi:porin